MKILLVSAAYPPYASGVSTSTANLALQLSKKHPVTVLTSTPNKRPQTQIPNPYLTLHLLPGVNLNFKTNFTLPYPRLKKVKTIINSFQPDIIHLQDFSPLGFSALNLAQENHLPTIITHHFTAEFIVKSIIPVKKLSHHLSLSSTSQQIIYRLVNLFYNRCQLVTVPNPALIPFIKQAKLKTPIISIPNGIITKNFTHKRPLSQILKTYHIKGSNIILFVGRLDLDKSLDLLLEAFKPIHRHNLQTSLVFVGDGNQKKKLINLTHKYHLDQAVHFLGKLDNQDQTLSHLYNAAHLFANPSIIENHSVSFLEAMTAGLPIVASNLPIQSNLIKPNHHGLLFEPNHPAALTTAIQKLLSDKKLHQTISRNNQKLSKQYDIAITSQQYLQAYQQLLS